MSLLPSDEEILAGALIAPLRECKHAADKFTGGRRACRFAVECRAAVYCIARMRHMGIFNIEHLGECPVTHGARRAPERS